MVVVVTTTLAKVGVKVVKVVVKVVVFSQSGSQSGQSGSFDSASHLFFSKVLVCDNSSQPLSLASLAKLISQNRYLSMFTATKW